MSQFSAICFRTIAVFGLLTGCAPTAVLNTAQESYKSARTAGAKEKAPYEFYAAKAYLELAGVANEEKNYKQAEDFARKSQEFSTQAFQKAGGGVK